MKHGMKHGKEKRKEMMMGGYNMKPRDKKMGGGRMQYAKGGSAQPMYGHGECPKASAN
jgi:hypothetical protein